jgi:hypothetical protein
VLGGTGDGRRLGLGVLSAHGMAAWMTAWQTPAPVPRVPAPRRPEATGPTGDMVRVLAAMALAHI